LIARVGRGSLVIEERAMPNIAIPDEHLANPIGYAIGNLAAEQTGPMYAFSTAVYKHSRLPLRVFEAARAMIALINGCRICQRFRSSDDVPTYLEGLGEDPLFGVHRNGPAPDEDFYRNIAHWREAEIYSARERLAIEFAERFSLAPDALGHDGAFWDRLRTQFSDEEIYELTVTCACLVASGRFVHVLGFDDGAVCDIRAEAAV
jgi:alkylhydroperoxidase family enzyme